MPELANIEKVKQLVADKEYEKAISESSRVLEELPQSYRFLMIRSQALLRSNQAKKALEDAEKAVFVGSGTERADAQLRRAVCYFQLKEYGKAKTAFDYAKDTSEKNQLQVWSSKMKAIADEPQPIPEVPQQQGAPVKKPSAPASSGPTLPRKDWYQTGNRVNVSIFVRNAPTDTKVEFNESSVHISNSDLDLILQLWGKIDPSDSKYEIGPPKIELDLRKASGVHWESLEVTNVQPTKDKRPAAFEKSWDVQDEHEEEEGNDDPMKFFQEIYKNADPDTQRAMMKSYVESQGTSLSTNWEEVKKDYVKPVPPKN